MLNKNDYLNAIEFILSKIEILPNHLSPKSILWSGSINSPGVSDIDLLIGFDDSFLYANEFLYEFKNIINNLDNKDIFFIHMPNIFPISSLKNLSKFTLNDFNKTKIIYGKNIYDLEPNQISNNQLLIRSMEFMHSRIIDFLINIHKKNININKLLIEGHSFLHSFNSLKLIGCEIELKEFTNFNKIEDLRKQIVDGKHLEIDEKELENTYKGICLEFYYLLQKLYQEFQKNVATHYSTNINFHEFDETIILNNLTKNKTINLSLNFKNNVFTIDGFSWELKCLFDNLFSDQNEYMTVFINKEFENSIKDKKLFLKNIFKFNFNNFGNSYGRSGFRPMIAGKNLDRIAKNLIY